MTEEIIYRLKVPAPKEITVDCGLRPISVSTTESEEPNLPKSVAIPTIYVDITNSPDRIKLNLADKLDYQWVQGDVKTARITSDGLIHAYDNLTADLKLPHIIANTEFIFDNHREVTGNGKLKSIVSDGNINVPIGIISSAKLSVIKSDSLVAVPANATGNIKLQNIKSNSFIVIGRVLNGKGTLQRITSDGQINVPFVISSDARLHPIVAQPSEIRVSRDLFGNGIIKNRLIGTLDFKIHRIIDYNASLPTIKSDGYVKVPIVIDSNSSLPSITSNGLLGVPTRIMGDGLLLHPFKVDAVFEFVKHAEAHITLPLIVSNGLIGLPTQIDTNVTLNVIKGEGELRLFDELNGNIVLKQFVADGLISDTLSNSIQPIVLSDSQLLIGAGIKLIKLGKET